MYYEYRVSEDGDSRGWVEERVVCYAEVIGAVRTWLDDDVADSRRRHPVAITIIDDDMVLWHIDSARDARAFLAAKGYLLRPEAETECHEHEEVSDVGE